MMSRRAVLGGPVFGGLLASMAPARTADPGEPVVPQDASERTMREVRDAIHDLRDEIRRESGFWELNALRDPIRMFLRTSAKYPDFIEVGIEVWHQVYDWHVRYQQPLTVGRNAEGRYTIMLMATMVIMRVEVQPNFIGIPFDNR